MRDDDLQGGDARGAATVRHMARAEHTENRRSLPRRRGERGYHRRRPSSGQTGQRRASIARFVPSLSLPPCPLFFRLPAFFLARDAKGAPSSIYRVLSLSLSLTPSLVFAPERRDNVPEENAERLAPLVHRYRHSGCGSGTRAGEFEAEANRVEPSRIHIPRPRVSQRPSTTAPPCIAVQRRRSRPTLSFPPLSLSPCRSSRVRARRLRPSVFVVRAIAHR